MCKKKQFKYCPSEIDDCMQGTIKILQMAGVKTLGCCCGHKKYPMTIVADIIIEPLTPPKPVEIFSGKIIPRKRRFYKKDKQGYYYIPEVVEKLNKKI